LELSDDSLKGNPALPRGLLKSKPPWSNASGYSITSAFFVAGRAEHGGIPAAGRREATGLEGQEQDKWSG
jgi:hypothetical protein